MFNIRSKIWKSSRPKLCVATLAEFFSALFGAADESHGRAVLYRKTPYRFEAFSPDDVDQLADRTAELGEEANIYNLVNLVGASAVAEIKRRRGRGREDEISSVVALVADIDAEKTGHNYPSQAVILETLKSMPLPPSLVILSGK